MVRILKAIRAGRDKQQQRKSAVPLPLGNRGEVTSQARWLHPHTWQ